MIDITKPVRTRDGTPVEIISDKGREPYTLVGYIGNGRELDEWAADGAYLPGTKRNNDLENYEPEPQPEPQPEEWAVEKAAFAAGKVIEVSIPSGQDWVETVHPEWSSHLLYRIKPEPQWKLPDPPAGQKWHRDDWAEDMLPEGCRPLLEGEARRIGIDEYNRDGSGNFILAQREECCVYGKIFHHHRTTRPLPQPEPKEWAEEKAAFVEGRAIQFQPKGFGEWFDCPEPTWSSDFKYRIKPEPQWVPMEPDDIVVGMEFTNDTGTRYQWTEVDTYGVTLLDSSISFEQLLRLGYEYRINGGEWKPCKKEVQV